MAVVTVSPGVYQMLHSLWDELEESYMRRAQAERLQGLRRSLRGMMESHDDGTPEAADVCLAVTELVDIMLMEWDGERHPGDVPTERT